MKPAVAPPEAPPSFPRVALRARPVVIAAAALGLVVLVAFIYRDAARSYFFNDDFQWLRGARDFAAANLLHIERYNHFYRPIIEIYFYLGRGLFGCNAFPFHVASIAIHLINTLLLYLFARTLTGSEPFAGLAALFFAVQPGHAEAVAWVGAITDLLPALWYLLAIWTHLLFLRPPALASIAGQLRRDASPKLATPSWAGEGGRGGARYYVVSLAAFTACLLTHESSATLLPMMVALEATVAWESRAPVSVRSIVARAARYAPFVLLLAAYLVVSYVVNSRSYLVREGHYQIGWHAVPHAIQYLITLYVGTRGLASQLFVVALVALLLARGTPRIRFFTLWMLVTIAPASFFTWGNVSRYLYLPAAGFALLLAEAVLAVRRLLARHTSRHTARAIAIAVTTVLAVRFAIFAAKVPAGFREWTRPYERYVEAVRKATAAAPSAAVISLDAADLEGIPVIYRDPAAEVASCGPDVHVVAR